MKLGRSNVKPVLWSLWHLLRVQRQQDTFKLETMIYARAKIVFATRLSRRVAETTIFVISKELITLVVHTLNIFGLMPSGPSYKSMVDVTAIT